MTQTTPPAEDGPLLVIPERILFVCSANYVRSPTAEHVARSMGHIADSCGIDPEAGKRLTFPRLAWASLIVCMEEVHYQYARTLFRAPLPKPEQRFVVWGVKDDADWCYCHPELVEICRGFLPTTVRWVQDDRELWSRTGADGMGTRANKPMMIADEHAVMLALKGLPEVNMEKTREAAKTATSVDD